VITLLATAAACATGAENPFAGEMVTSATFTTTSGGTDTSNGSETGDPTSTDPTSTSATTASTTDADDTASTTDDPTADSTGPGLPCTTDAECDDGSACTENVCDAANGCQNPPISCDDQDLCTDDTCDPVMGCLNDPVACDDGVGCTTDSCDPQSGSCVNQPDNGMCSNGDACDGTETCNAAMGCVAGTPVVCNDNNACTQNVCNSGNGSCSYPTVQTCSNNDGCCPAGCSAGADNDCDCDNFADQATTSSSGGGLNSTGYGPINLNDNVSEAQCLSMGCNQCFAWITNSASSTGWFQLQWPNQRTIGSVYIEGENGTNPGCSSQGRNLRSGNLQYWNGNNWVNAASFNNNNDDLAWDFNPPLTTDRLRLANVTAGPSGFAQNSMLFEWYVYQPLGCFPP
jgi:hypothetical protein